MNFWYVFGHIWLSIGSVLSGVILVSGCLAINDEDWHLGLPMSLAALVMGSICLAGLLSW